MNNEELKIYIESSIDSLKKHTDNDKWMEGYIRALEDIQEKLKG